MSCCDSAEMTVTIEAAAEERCPSCTLMDNLPAEVRIDDRLVGFASLAGGFVPIPQVLVAPNRR
jgi:hypothetical protein